MKMPTAILAILLAAPSQDEAVQPLAIGSDAPDFSLPGVDGKTWRLADFASSKLLAVVFTSNHCPTAQAYEDRIKKLVSDYSPRGVALVAIQPNSPKGLRLDELGYTDLGDTLADMKIRAKDKAFNFPYIDDGDTQKVSRAYGCKATPHAFLFDAARKLRYAGRIDDSEHPDGVKVSDLRNALDALLAGKDVEVPTTKPFGCSTKWASKEDSVRKFMEKVAAEPVSVATVDESGLAALRTNSAAKLRLLHFWSGPEELPEFVEMHRMYRRRAFELVTVAVRSPGEKDDVEKTLKKAQCSATNLILGGSDRARQLAAFDKDWDGAVPYTVLLNAEGKVLYKAAGKIAPLDLKRAVVETLGRIYPKK